MKDKFGFELLNFSHLIETDSRLYDEPYVLSAQVILTFYVNDEMQGHWVVVNIKSRDVFEVGCSVESDDKNDNYHENEWLNIEREVTHGKNTWDKAIEGEFL